MTKIKSQGDGLLPAVSRRQFIQAGSALAACRLSPALAKQRRVKAPPHKTSLRKTLFRPAAHLTAGGKCDIRAHVNDGVVTRISTRPDNELDPQMPVMRACVRGRASTGNLFTILTV
ncbi:anaerobic dimethyl sulfoxide reductase subunit A [Enterobacter cloacae]|uniref:Anaerobic dimethyl sulfoxide reductase subunit A n=1 Tax=Enterobacter cloacae TaxID=550 RepID=A0A377LVY3_ENTCL|nr:anaerobic dimethyl sulfoxide reductase subunit A [Enterobacter cloacae]